MSSPTTVAAVNVGEEKRVTGSIGSLTRRSTATSPTPATADTARPATTTGENQPDGPASIRATEPEHTNDTRELPRGVDAVTPARRRRQKAGADE